jgi:DcaP outer membrane protein
MHLVNKPSALLLASLALIGASASQTAYSQDQGRSFEIYGFAMLDWIEDSKRVDPSWEDAFRPSKIATPEGEFGSNGQSDVSVKQSRFGVKGTMPTGESTAPLSFKFEFDMFGVGGDAGKTTIRLRHAYGEWESLLAGQTMSVFMDLDVFPNVIDYWGPPGMVFLRNPQIRWTPYRVTNGTTQSEFAVAIERPSNDVDSGNIRTVQGFENATVRGDETIPDLTAHFRVDDTWGHAQIAAILRRVGYEYQPDVGSSFSKGSETGWGINLSGAIKLLEKDQVLLSVVHGNGIATYMNDGGMDLAPTASDPTVIPPATTSFSAEAVPLTGVVAYYDHYWNSLFSSSVGYSFDQVTNTNFQAGSAFHKGQYASVNLLMYPANNVMVGAEIMWGELTDNSGTTGIDWRFQFSAKYNFGIKL